MDAEQKAKIDCNMASKTDCEAKIWQFARNQRRLKSIKTRARKNNRKEKKKKTEGIRKKKKEKKLRMNLLVEQAD